MERIEITIRPPLSDEKLLRVIDAMQQVIDALKLLEEADKSLGPETPNRKSFEWRLERASAESPFTVIALAESVDPSEDISVRVKAAKSEVSRGLNRLITSGQVAPWMDLQPTGAVRSILARNLNGIGRTDINFMEGDSLSIDRAHADSGLRALAAITVMDVAASLPEREAFGELVGVMVAAGRYQRKPAVQVLSELYGFVWCVLSPKIIQKFGTEHRMADIWDGKTLGVEGVFNYYRGGKLAKIAASNIREIPAAEPIDLDTVLDPNFTSGFDPHEYLNRLHEGELA